VCGFVENQKWVVKVYFDRESGQGDKVTEYGNLNQFRHPNIIQLAPSQLESNALFSYIVIERGLLSLHDHIRGSFEYSTKKVLVDILTGLEFLASHGVAHGDVKPMNVIVMTGEVCKLGDFGDSVTRAKDFPSTEVLATLQYRAPEALRKGEWGPEVDLWGAGAIGADLEMQLSPSFLSDKLPKDCNETNLELAHARMFNDPDGFCSGFKEGMLIKMLLAKDPAYRPTASEALARLE